MKINNFTGDLFSIKEQNDRLLELEIRLGEAEQIIKDIAKGFINKEVMIEVCQGYVERKNL